jgi:hypothetical protein
MSFKKHPLAYILLPLCILALGVSYYRFLIAEDYRVTYEGACDPVTESCFVGCEDDACSEPYYYALIEKRAANVRAICGADLVDCEHAMTCNPSEEDCGITHCSEETRAIDESCEDFDASDETSVVSEEGAGQEETEL